MIGSCAPWLHAASVALFGLSSAAGVAGVAGIFARRRRPQQTQQPSSAYIVVGNKKVPLTQPVQLGRSFWQRVANQTVKASEGAEEMGESYAELFQAPDGAWEVRLADGAHLYVDGLRSRHNRLQRGVLVALGPSQQVTFQFFGQN